MLLGGVRLPGPIASAGISDVQGLLDQRGPRRPPARVKETRLATLHGRVQRSARNAVLGLAGRVPAVRRFLAQNLSELAVSYGHGRGGPGTRPGDRASVALPPLPPGVPAWRLLLPQNATAEQIAVIRRCGEAQPVPVLVHRCDGIDDAQLVRPDGYLARVGTVDRARDLLERPLAGRSA